MTKNKVERSNKHKALIVVAFLIVFGGIFYAYGEFYYQKDKQIDRLVQNLQKPDVNISSYVSAANPDMKVTNESLKPLQSYFKENKNAAKELKSNLKSGKDGGQIWLIQSGSHFLIFPKYVLRVKVYRPQVETNHPNSILSVNGRSLGKMEGGDQNFYQELGMVFPGRYHIAVSTKVQNRDLKADSVTNIWSDKTINMTIKTGTFQVYSVPNGEVYINDRKVKKLDKNGRAIFKNYPLSQNMELYVKSSYDGKTIKSYKVKDLSSSIESEFSKSDDTVSDYGNFPAYNGNQKDDVYQDVEGDYVVNPHWPGLIDENEAEKILTENYTKTVKDAFETGKENADYKALQKAIKLFNKDKSHLKLEVQVTQILPAGKNYSEVDYQLVYKYTYKKKKYRKVINYHDAIFHKVGDKQLIKSLGKKEK